MYKQNLNPRKERMLVRRADGEETTAVETVTTDAEAAVRGAQLLGELIGGRQRNRAGMKINGTFFPLSDILLAGILVAVTVVACVVARRK